jgi:hypothetical protein
MPLMEQELQAASNGLRGVFACPFLAELRHVKFDVVMPLFKSFSNIHSASRRLLVIAIFVSTSGSQGVPMPPMEQALRAALNGLRGVFVRPVLAELQSAVVQVFFKRSLRRRLLIYRDLHGDKRCSGRSNATNGTSALSGVE